MMLPTNPAPRDHAPGVGGPAGCRLTQVLQAALTSIGETKQRASAPNTSSSSPAEGRGKFKCDDCGRLFSTKGNMMRHVQATHTREGVKMFPCGVCGRKFKRREDLVTHGRVHTGEKPYACSHKGCGRRFARISDQRSHERIHSSDAKRYECKHCGKRFTRPYDLKKHEMNIHRQELSAIGKRKESSVGADTSFGGGVGGGTARNGGSKRLRVTGVEVSGTIPGKNQQACAAHSSQPLPKVASAAANGLVATAAVQQQQLQEQAARSPQPLPTMASAAANGSPATAVQQQQQQQLQEQAGPSSQPRPMVASAAANGLVATTVQQQQPQEQAALSSQPLQTQATAAAAIGLVPTVQHQQAQEQHNQQWRKEYQVWQSKQKLLNNQRQPHPGKPGSLADSSLPTTGQEHQLLPPPPLPSPPQGPALAKAAVAPPPRPKPAAAPHKLLRRKRVRCDAHKHFDPTAAGSERVSSQGAANMVNAPRGSATGGSMQQHGDDRQQEQKITEPFAEAKTHVHGAACGHVAVRHENHVDFLVENGQLECFVGMEKTPEGWVSTTKEGGDGQGCGCHDAARKTNSDAAGSSNSNSNGNNGDSNSNNSSSNNTHNNSDNGGSSNSTMTNNNDNNSSSNNKDNNSNNNNNDESSNSNSNTRDCCKGKSKSNDSNPNWKVVTRDDLIHWDGARTDQPRGNCPGDIHGPHCGHDVIHHNGHLDYVVNGRLIHPVQVDPTAADGNGDGTGTGGAATTQFEDHGSIQALDEDFVTFWSSFSLLSETADEEVLSFCDICSSDDAGGVNLSPVA